MSYLKHIESLSSSEFREKFGKVDKVVDVPQDAKKYLKREKIEIESEKQVDEDSMNMAQALLIMAYRSERMRKIRKDPELRMMLSKKD